MKLKNLSSILSLVTLVFILAFYWLVQTKAIWQNQYPRGDEAAYLATAIYIHDEGGALNLIPRMFTGDYKEANRHPFYVGILSIFAKPSLDFFAEGKILNLFLGLVYLIVLFAIMRRLLSDFWGLLMTLLFAGNYFFVNQISKVSTEPLFFLTVLVGWYMIVRDKKPSDDRQALLSGGSTAFSYLTKVTGIFLLGSYVLTSLLYPILENFRRHRAEVLNAVLAKKRPLALFVVSFVLVALPLLWRNVLVYQNPIHNYNSKLIFISSGEERRAVGIYEGNTADVKDLLEGQSIMVVVKRLLKGMLGESVILSQLVFFEYGRIRGAILVLILLAIGLARDKNRWRSLFSLLLFSMFFVFFSWYFKISSHFRYILPMLFLLYFYIFRLLRESIATVCQRIRSRGYEIPPFDKLRASSLGMTAGAILPQVILLIFSGFAFVYETQQHDFVSPAHAYKVPTAYVEVEKWIASNVEMDERFMNGPGHDFQVEWLTGTSARSFEMPFVKNMTELNSFLRDYKIDYVIISQPTIEGREAILEDYFEAQGEGIIMKETPVGWTLVKAEDRPKPRYLIYKVL